MLNFGLMLFWISWILVKNWDHIIKFLWCLKQKIIIFYPETMLFSFCCDIWSLKVIWKNYSCTYLSIWNIHVSFELVWFTTMGIVVIWCRISLKIIFNQISSFRKQQKIWRDTIIHENIQRARNQIYRAQQKTDYIVGQHTEH